MTTNALERARAAAAKVLAGEGVEVEAIVIHAAVLDPPGGDFRSVVATHPNDLAPDVARPLAWSLRQTMFAFDRHARTGGR